MTGRAVALSLVWLGVVALVLPGAAQAALVVALLHLGIGVALPALVGKPSPEASELPATLVLLSIGRAVAALAAVRGVVGPPVQMGVLSWLSEALGPLGAPALFVAVAVIAGVTVGGGVVRVAEVAARFALDAMPGKQLGLDTALQRGSMDAAAAVERLNALETQAGFFGAMDGAARFLRAESMAVTSLGVVALGIAGGLHPSAWVQPVAFAAIVFGLLLAAAAATGTQAALAVTQAAGGRRVVPARVNRRLLGGVAAAAGLVFVVVGLSSWPAVGLLVPIGIVLLLSGATCVLRLGSGGAVRSYVGVWMVRLSPRLQSVPEGEIASILSSVREDVRLRLGFDPGAPAVVSADWGADPQAEVWVRDMMAGPVDVQPGRKLVPCAPEDANAAAPDGRAAAWVEGPSLAGWEWDEVLRWGVFSRLVATAPLLFTAEHAAEWAERAGEEVPFSGAAGPAMSWVLGVMRDLLREGLPVVAPALAADVAAEGDPQAQRALLRRFAAHRMFAEARGAFLARQLHPNGRALLDRLENGHPVGHELDSLRAVLLAEARKRPDWRWPMVFVESRHVEQLTALLAGKTDQAVVLRPEELPTSLPSPPIEVLENGFCESL